MISLADDFSRLHGGKTICHRGRKWQTVCHHPIRVGRCGQIGEAVAIFGLLQLEVHGGWLSSSQVDHQETKLHRRSFLGGKKP